MFKLIKRKENEKEIFKYSSFALFVSMLWGCSDWTKPEAEDFFEMPGNDYYENLRAYKRSEHSVAFGWFGGWTGVGASMVGSLMGLPDSVDFVSIWGNWKNLDEARMLDKKKVKEQKGTRALMCFIVANVGDQLTPEEHKENYKEYWGWKDGDQEAIDGAIRKYANAIVTPLISMDTMVSTSIMNLIMVLPETWRVIPRICSLS